MPSTRSAVICHVPPSSCDPVSRTFRCLQQMCNVVARLICVLTAAWEYLSWSREVGSRKTMAKAELSRAAFDGSNWSLSQDSYQSLECNKRQVLRWYGTQVTLDE